MKKYNYIVKANKVENVLEAVSLYDKGHSVLLIDKYGFPGSELFNSLDLILNKKEYLWLEEFYNWSENHKSAILFNDENYLVFHHEYLKRYLWEKINDSGIDFLFHVVEIKRTDDSLTLFGREGNIEFSFDNYINGIEKVENENFINLFIEKDSREYKHSIKTVLGYYTQIKSDSKEKSELSLNRELGRIIKRLQLEGNRPIVLPSAYSYKSFKI